MQLCVFVSSKMGHTSRNPYSSQEASNFEDGALGYSAAATLLILLAAATGAGVVGAGHFQGLMLPAFVGPAALYALEGRAFVEAAELAFLAHPCGEAHGALFVGGASGLGFVHVEAEEFGFFAPLLDVGGVLCGLQDGVARCDEVGHAAQRVGGVARAHECLSRRRGRKAIDIGQAAIGEQSAGPAGARSRHAVRWMMGVRSMRNSASIAVGKESSCRCSARYSMNCMIDP